MFLLYTLAYALDGQVPLQGSLTDAAGAPLAGSHVVHLYLHGDAGGTQELHHEQQTIVVTGGQFSTVLGLTTALNLDVFATDPSIWVSVSVGDGPRSAGVPVATTPYAAWAARAGRATTADTVGSLAPADLVTWATGYLPGAGLTLTGRTFAVTSAALTPAWSSLTGVPTGFSDGTDNDTTYTGTSGIALNGTAFSADTTWFDARYVTRGGSSDVGVLSLVASTATCPPTPVGSIRFDGTNLQACTATGWQNLALASGAGAGSGATSGTAAASCLAIKQANSGATDGLYWIKPGASAAFQTWCDMTTASGGWTLVASVNDSPTKRSVDDQGQRWQRSGSNAWADQSTFGDATTATAQLTGSFKNPAYWELGAQKNIMFYITPNGTAPAAYRTAANFVAYTASDPLTAKGGSLYALFTSHNPLTTGGGSTAGYGVDVTFSVGNGTNLQNLFYVNTRTGTQINGVAFSVRNSEGYPHAFCLLRPGSHGYWQEVEHYCVGGNGTTGGIGAGGYGNLRDLVYSGTDWGANSTTITAGTILLFVRG